jgi:hypothetical protein
VTEPVSQVTQTVTGAVEQTVEQVEKTAEQTTQTVTGAVESATTPGTSTPAESTTGGATSTVDGTVTTVSGTVSGTVTTVGGAVTPVSGTATTAGGSAGNVGSSPTSGTAGSPTSGATGTGGRAPTVVPGMSLESFTAAGGGRGAWTTSRPMPNGTVTSSVKGAVRTKRPARPRAIVIRFRAHRAGRIGLRVVQIWPTCRPAGLISMRVHRGVNRLRFNGKLGRGWLLDGTYVLATPLRPIRFAVVAGRPTRKRERLQPSTCREGAESALLGAPVAIGAAAAGVLSAERNEVDTNDASQPGGVLRPPLSAAPRVLGETMDKVGTAVTSVPPAFYGLLLGAILVLALATLPATVVPSTSLAAALTRHRAGLVLAGTATLIALIVVYLVLFDA